MSVENARILVGNFGEMKKDTKASFVRTHGPSDLAAFLQALPPDNQAKTFTGRMMVHCSMQV
jgi:hypothetical protein